MKTLGWVLLRDNTAHPSELKVPAWSSFDQILESEQNLSQANVGYLPLITVFPTQMNVNYKFIDRTLSIKKELGLSYIFLEVDQVIYVKTLDVMFKLKKENSCVSGFHIIICLFRTIFSCFRNTGLI